MEEGTEAKTLSISNSDQAIQALKDGNNRFFGGDEIPSWIGPNERLAQVAGQSPYVALLACSDSRVPVEQIFNEKPGRLFVVRVAGNVAGESELGTLEYGIRHLGVNLVMVLGHEGCGAVAASLLPEEQLAQEPSNLQSVVKRIHPSVKDLSASEDPKARMREAVLRNIRYQVSVLRQQQVIQEAEVNGQIGVIGGYYEIGSGSVNFLTTEEDLAV